MFPKGELKKRIAQEIGLEPNQQRLLFRGMEKDDQEYLHMVGVKDNAKVLLMEEQKTNEINSEEVEGSGFSSAAEVRLEKEVDYFSPRLVLFKAKHFTM